MPHRCTSCGRGFEDGSKEMLSGCPDCGGNKFQFIPGGVESDAAGASHEPPADRQEPAADPRELPPDSPPSTDDAPEPTETPASPAEEFLSKVTGGRAGSTGETCGSGEASLPTGETTSRGDTRDSGTETECDADIIEADEDLPPGDDGDEDHAQTNARSGFVSPDELEQSRDAADEDETEPTESPGEAEQPNTATAAAATGGADSGTAEPEPEAAPPEQSVQKDLDELRAELNDQFESIKIVAPGQYELNLMELYDREEYVISLREDGRYVIEMPDSWEVEKAGADDGDDQ